MHMVTKEFLKEMVRKKKELRALAAPVIDDVLTLCLRQHQLKAEDVNERDARLIIKEVRAKLRVYTGRFQRSHEKRSFLLDARRYEDVLMTHASSADRMADYPALRNELEKIQIRSILDLGCGLNPLALARVATTYYAVDIREDELALVAEFFKQENISGKTIVCDIRKELPVLPPVDVCLLMNILDIIESRVHIRAEEIITNVKAKYFFITFSTKTLSGKPMRHPQRGWIERLLTRRRYLWKRITLSTEVLYIAQSMS